MKMLKNEKGSTLALCVIISCILSVFVVGLWGILIASRRQKISELSEERGFYLSDSCIALTEARLQDKVIQTIMTTLNDEINSKNAVPVNYFGPNGEFRALDRETFCWLYTSYAMQLFSSNETGSPREKFKFSTDPSYLGTADDPSISSAAFTAALTATQPELQGYSIIVDIDSGNNINTNYGEDFAKIYRYCYPSYADTRKGEFQDPSVGHSVQYRKYDDEGNGISMSDDDFYPADPLSNEKIAKQEKNLNTGLLRATYTIKDSEGKVVEKARVTYTFDIYHPIIEICRIQAENVFPDEGADPSAELIQISPDLKFNAIREYLVP